MATTLSQELNMAPRGPQDGRKVAQEGLRRKFGTNGCKRAFFSGKQLYWARLLFPENLPNLGLDLGL